MSVRWRTPTIKTAHAGSALTPIPARTLQDVTFKTGHRSPSSTRPGGVGRPPLPPGRDPYRSALELGPATGLGLADVDASNARSVPGWTVPTLLMSAVEKGRLPFVVSSKGRLVLICLLGLLFWAASSLLWPYSQF